jgi:hypothetical protein
LHEFRALESSSYHLEMTRARQLPALLLLALLCAPVAGAEPPGTPVKVMHAEPLFIDLIRDLGARKGEREWNIGLGLVDQSRYDRYETLVEYEWAPANRLGLEIEVPLKFYPQAGTETPSNRIEGLKTAAQWTFLVSEAQQTSLAVGYLNEVVFTDLEQVRQSPFVSGNVANPFFVAARRLGPQWHSLVYTGPRFETLRGHAASWQYDINSSVHYMVGQSRNFVGVEVNKTWASADFDMTLRPQMRLQINDQLLIGIVTGVPVKRERERLSMFLRFIYEPRHK